MKYFIEDTTLTDISDAVREKEESTQRIPVVELAGRIRDIQTGSTVGKQLNDDGTQNVFVDDTKGDTIDTNKPIASVKYNDVDVELKPPSLLPDGYTQLEYIESTGTQYIDTGWKPTSMDFEIESKLKITGRAEDQTIFGVGQGTNEAGLIVNMMVNRNLWQFAVNNVWVDATHPTCAVNEDISVTVKGSSTGTSLTVNGEHILTNAQTTPSLSSNVAIFAAYWQPSYIRYFASAKMYYFKVYENGNLVRDFVPCANETGVVGLYDLATKAFFGNQGSGEFNPSVAPVLLWTNASPTSSFAAQTIALNGAEYSGYLIEFTNSVMTLCVNFGDANILLYSGNYYRTISNFTNTGVTFSNVNNTVQNVRMVPTRIFGIKFTV